MQLLSLQKQAIDAALSAFSRLPSPSQDAVFRQCIFEKSTITEIVAEIEKKYWNHRKRRSTKLLLGFQRYTVWLQSISDVVDTVVQVNSGIACPLWAPVKLILKVGSGTTSVVLFISLFPVSTFACFFL